MELIFAVVQDYSQSYDDEVRNRNKHMDGLMVC